jgi:phosphoribosyl 1,2-cyclic phosphodiesterase
MLKLQTLASGSKGNCIYVGSKTTQILLDVGLTLAQVESRMKQATLDPNQITAVLITHEHTDHISGLALFLRKYQNCMLYLHESARDVIPHILYKQKFHDHSRICYFNKPFEIGDININFFDVPHDSEFCFGYTFKSADAKLGIATDLGHVTTEIISAMANSQIVVLESNHDLGKLSANIKYPLKLKRRVAGSHGHLSNTAASLAIYELVKVNVGQIVLAHISEQNNSPTLAYTFIRDFLARKGLQEGTDIFLDVAQQHQIGKLFRIN